MRSSGKKGISCKISNEMGTGENGQEKLMLEKDSLLPDYSIFRKESDAFWNLPMSLLGFPVPEK